MSYYRIFPSQDDISNDSLGMVMKRPVLYIQKTLTTR